MEIERTLDNSIDSRSKWKEGLLERTGTKSNHTNNYNKKRVAKYIIEYSNKYIANDIKFVIEIRGKFKMTKTVYDLKEAKLVVDKFLISKGLESIYILKKK